MFYRLLDQSTGKYLTNGYNEESQKAFKKAVNEVLLEQLPEEDVAEVIALKWDKFTLRMIQMDFLVEEAHNAFNSKDLEDDEYNPSVDDYGFEFDDNWPEELYDEDF